MTSLISRLKSFFSKSNRDQNIDFLKKVFEISINDPAPYVLALTHRSSGGREDNERLELLGDAVLDLIAADFIFHLYEELDEGRLTKLKSKLISREQLTYIAIKEGLVDNLSLIKQKDLSDELIIGNVLEAIYGAMYIDQGFTITREAGVKMFERNCDLDEILSNLHDPKSLLLEWSQKTREQVNLNVVPFGETHFKAEVFVNNEKISEGKGVSKKKAEKDACSKALLHLEISS